jgi:hypothetical protein
VYIAIQNLKLVRCVACEKYKLVVKPHKIGSFFMYLKLGRKREILYATLFYNAANVTKEQSLMKVFRFKSKMRINLIL